MIPLLFACFATVPTQGPANDTAEPATGWITVQSVASPNEMDADADADADSDTDGDADMDTGGDTGFASACTGGSSLGTNLPATWSGSASAVTLGQVWGYVRVCAWSCDSGAFVASSSSALPIDVLASDYRTGPTLSVAIYALARSRCTLETSAGAIVVDMERS